jgi:hypothetical protein
VAREQPYELRAGVAGRADHGNGDTRGHYASMQDRCMTMQSARVLETGRDSRDAEPQQILDRVAIGGR